MCNYNGFSQYCGLADVKPMPVVRVEKSKVDRQDKDKDILDFIFACDPITGFPTGSLSHYLSDETRTEIKDYIERYLLRDIPESHFLQFPQEIAQHIKELDSNFVFDCMRGPYETAEMYKDRLTSWMKELSVSEKNKKWTENLLFDLKKINGKTD